MSDSNRILWVNGHFITDHEAMLPAESKGLMYGAGCFETLSSRSGQFLHLSRHIKRLNRGLDYLGLSGGGRFSEVELRSILKDLLAKNGLAGEIAVVRIQVSLGGGRGFGINDDDVHTVISADPLSATENPWRLTISDVRSVPSQSRPPDLKLSNYLHYMTAWKSARRKGFDDALLLTSDGAIAETTISNIFWKREGDLFTPDSDCDILPGIMRDIFLQIIDREQLGNLERGRYSPDVLNRADLVWITNSVKGFQPVSAVDSVTFQTEDPFYDRLFTAYEHYLNSHLK